MDNTEIYKLSSLVLREKDDFEEEMLKKDSVFLFEHAKEIYATKFIADCLVDPEFLQNISYDVFPSKDVLHFITHYYLNNHDEIREADLTDMLEYYGPEIKKAAKRKYAEM